MFIYYCLLFYIREGAIIVSKLLELLSPFTKDNHVVEVGCGTGLCGIIMNITMKAKVTLTDHTIDLATLNLNSLKLHLTDDITAMG